MRISVLTKEVGTRKNNRCNVQKSNERTYFLKQRRLFKATLLFFKKFRKDKLMKQKRQILMWSLPCLITLLVMFVIPMVYTFIKAILTDNLTYYKKFFSDTFYLSILWSTIMLSVKTTVLTLAIGYPTAYFLARTRSKIKGILLIATVFPFLVSAVVRGFGWMVILGDHGIINEILIQTGLRQKPFKIMYTELAVLIGMVQLLLPYMILSVTSVIQGIDYNIEYAAYSLGANPVKTFLKVTLPLSAPGVLSGSILVFTLSMTSYITPQLLGGAKYLTVSTLIFNQVKTTYNLEFANAICYILVFAILLFQVMFNFVSIKTLQHVGGAKNA